jgi:hypothetical protein
MKYIISTYQSYSVALCKYTLKNEVVRELAFIKAAAVTYYNELWPVYMSFASKSNPTDDVIEKVKMIKQHMHADSANGANNGLFTESEWNACLVDTVATSVSNIWVCKKSFSPSCSRNPSCNYSYFSTAGHGDAVGLLEAIIFTRKILENEALDSVRNRLVEVVVLKIIKTVPIAIAKASVRSDIDGEVEPLLRFLEKHFLPLVMRCSARCIEESFLRDVIAKKMEMRDYIPGYSVAMKEMLDRHPAVRSQHFFLFFPVLHQPLPHCDVEWAMRLAAEDNQNYEKEVLNHSGIATELRFIMVTSSAIIPPICEIADDDVVSNKMVVKSVKKKKNRKQEISNKENIVVLIENY